MQGVHGVNDAANTPLLHERRNPFELLAIGLNQYHVGTECPPTAQEAR